MNLTPANAALIAARGHWLHRHPRGPLPGDLREPMAAASSGRARRTVADDPTTTAAQRAFVVLGVVAFPFAMLGFGWLIEQAIRAMGGA